MNLVKFTMFFLLFCANFNFFASEEQEQKSYRDRTYSWLQESNQNHPTFWKYICLASSMGCATGLVISSLKTGLYLLYTLKDVFSGPSVMESQEEKEQRVLDKFYKMIGSLFAAGILFFGADFFNQIPHRLENNLPLFK